MGTDGWETEVIAPSYSHLAFGVDEGGNYWEKSESAGTLGSTFRRQAYLDATRLLPLPAVHKDQEEHDNSEADYGDWIGDEVGVVYEEEMRSRGESWVSELFDTDRDREAVTVIFKHSEGGSIHFVVPQHCELERDNLVHVGPEASATLFPGM
jgi:hypothetical protein